MLSFDALRAACAALPPGDAQAEAAVAARQATLTKPLGSLGRLEQIAGWLARWQGLPTPRLDRVQVIVFAGNHGVTAQGVSPYPPEVTAQMVANYAAGGAAINQIARVAGAALQVVPLALNEPTADMTIAPALTEAGFVHAVAAGMSAVPDCDLLCLGEMGIGNTTAAAALCAALFGGTGADWAGRGTGVDDAGLRRKQDVIDRALAFHTPCDPLHAAARLGGRELAAILGAVLAARQRGIPVLLDGFVCTAAAAPLFALERDRPDRNRSGRESPSQKKPEAIEADDSQRRSALARQALDHTLLAHVSAEAGHRRLAQILGMVPLLDLGMRLGEASGAALAVPVLRAALACHTGMASFAEAGVADRA